VFLSSHLLSEVEQTCDRVAIIRQGVLIRSGKVKELLMGEQSLIHLQVSPTEKAVQVLAEHWPVAKNAQLSGWLQMQGDPEDCPKIISQLVAQDVNVYQIYAEHQSLEKFLHLNPQINDHKDFNKIIGNFYKYLCQNGLEIHKETRYSEALGEIVWLLEKSYQGYETRGYDGAYFDALSEDNEGLDFILQRVVEILKQINRRKYISWLITSTIDALDWDLKVQLVSDILNNHNHLLHPEITKLSPSQLAPYIEDLILIIADSFLPPSSFIL
jgi:hypothetical protein